MVVYSVYEHPCVLITVHNKFPPIYVQNYRLVSYMPSSNLPSQDDKIFFIQWSHLGFPIREAHVISSPKLESSYKHACLGQKRRSYIGDSLDKIKWIDSHRKRSVYPAVLQLSWKLRASQKTPSTESLIGKSVLLHTTPAIINSQLVRLLVLMKLVASANSEDFSSDAVQLVIGCKLKLQPTVNHFRAFYTVHC